MEQNSQNLFKNRVFQNQVNFHQNSTLPNMVANLKAMSVDPTKKNQVLSSLSRFQNQMNSRDYDEILANVKSVNRVTSLGQNRALDDTQSLGNSRTINDQDYQRTVAELKRLEHETRFR